ncbi:MAG: hypothetical protein HFH87_01270 [Lachnospiraceae bacterium]|nr:hypothetical protein [Lachnospiraceae bacterium]
MKKNVINSIVLLLTGTIAGSFITKRMMDKRVEQNQKMADKHLALFLMMNQWVKMKQKGKNLVSYFEQNGYWEVAIYGMGYAGRTLVDELENSSVRIKYGIDQNMGIDDERFDIILPEDTFEPVDVIVVTPITFFAEIAERLREKTDCAIVSLEDVLFGI